MADAYKPVGPAGKYHEKLDPRLAALIEIDRAHLEGDAPPGSTGLRGGPAPEPVGLRRSGLLAFVDSEGEEAGTRGPHRKGSVLAFITYGGDWARLSAMGVKLRSIAGDVATARLPLRLVEPLERDPSVRYIEISRRTTLDKMAAPSAPALRGLSPTGDAPEGSPAGKGTFIGIVDVGGLDLYHPDFHTPPPERNRSRVEYLWDQNAAGPRGGVCGQTPSPWGYGRELTRQDIESELGSEQTRRRVYVEHEAVKQSHGTGVASIAAGGGARDPRARGVASLARIIYVDTVSSGAEPLAGSSELAEAVDYVFQRADHAPCSVNVSLGDDLGPHDGTSPVERFFENLLAAAPGRMITIAAGNSTTRGKHATGTLVAGETVDIELRVGRSESINAAIEIWYPGTADLEVSVVSPGGAITPAAGPKTGPTPGDLGDTRVLVTAGASPLNSKKYARIELFPRVKEGTMEGGTWKVRLTCRRAPCTWHGWIDHRYIRWISDSDDLTITAPATCRSAVAVGAYVPVSGAAAYWSGRGFARKDEEYVKPDVAAPGLDLLSASASTTDPCMLMTGTSAAAPQVAGVIALLFERFGPLEAPDVRWLLGKLTAGGADPALGQGIISAASVRERLEGAAGEAVRSELEARRERRGPKG